MWRKEEPKSQAVAENSTGFAKSTTSSGPPPAATPQENSPMPPVSPKAIACVSKGIKIRGEITGKEDLFVDGEIEGKLELGDASVTVGPNGRVKAEIVAREVIVRGRVEGNVKGRERVHVWATGSVAGDIQAERLAIEEGGVLRGRVEAGKRPEQGKAHDSFPAAVPASAARQDSAVIATTNVTE